MHLMRESWTDDRLDDLNRKVDRGFAETKNDVVKFRAETRGEFDKFRAETKGEFDKVRAEIASLRSEMHAGFNSLHKTMVQFSSVMVAAAIGLLATQL
ncbi:MAG TPA: hypothetical protein VFX85_13355 [Solirubrobacterales bacterium]|nr:hypothetical protein [Solirubrobacterales bacterium]